MTNVSWINSPTGAVPMATPAAPADGSGADFGTVLAGALDTMIPTTGREAGAAPAALPAATAAPAWETWGRIDPTTGAFLDRVTGRHAYYGPQGEPGRPWAPGQPIPAGMAVVQQPDKSWAAYTPGDFTYADPTRKPNVPPAATTAPAHPAPPAPTDTGNIKQIGPGMTFISSDGAPASITETVTAPDGTTTTVTLSSPGGSQELLPSAASGYALNSAGQLVYVGHPHLWQHEGSGTTSTEHAPGQR